MRDESPQSVRLRACDPPADRCQPVVLPPLVVDIGGGPARRFRDPPVAEHPVEGAVQSARLQLDVAIGQSRDFLKNGVAMAFFAGQSEQDVEFDRPQRHSVCSLYARRIEVKSIRREDVPES